MESYFDREAAERAWERSADLRAEFLGDKECYLAFAEANARGLIKIQRRD